MFKNRIFSFLKYNKFEFGTQPISQFVIFECKWLFSIIIFYFHKSDGCQDRFHTHAFNALSVKLFGTYDEHILTNKFPEEYITVKRTKTFVYFPRNSYHRIAKSTGCSTILFSGPWKDTWEEFIKDKTQKYSWGRSIPSFNYGVKEKEII